MLLVSLKSSCVFNRQAAIVDKFNAHKHPISVSNFVKDGIIVSQSCTPISFLKKMFLFLL